VFLLIKKLLADFHLRKQGGLVQIIQATRLFVCACLLEVHALARAIERDFALLATTLRTNASVNGGTKTFFFSFFADRTTHESQLLKLLSHAAQIFPAEPGRFLSLAEAAQPNLLATLKGGKA
jgi:hypothetical protein